jgi:hypothetical protein
MFETEVLASQLQTARAQARGTYQSQYPDKIIPFTDSIKRRMLATGEGALLATLECAKLAPGPMEQMLFLSAGMEMVAPSKAA